MSVARPLTGIPWVLDRTGQDRTELEGIREYTWKSPSRLERGFAPDATQRCLCQRIRTRQDVHRKRKLPSGCHDHPEKSGMAAVFVPNDRGPVLQDGEKGKVMTAVEDGLLGRERLCAMRYALCDLRFAPCVRRRTRPEPRVPIETFREG